jgi:hypothetical protein
MFHHQSLGYFALTSSLPGYDQVDQLIESPQSGVQVRVGMPLARHLRHWPDWIDKSKGMPDRKAEALRHGSEARVRKKKDKNNSGTVDARSTDQISKKGGRKHMRWTIRRLGILPARR